jgi:3-hydroxybutyryl-CoA dehydrogenase
VTVTMTAIPNSAPVLVVGAGIMGSGITQVAALAGHPVLLYDIAPGAATNALANLSQSFDKLVAKGKFDQGTASQALARIKAIESLQEAKPVPLAIEAVVEDIGIKRSLFQQLETIVSDDCILASNTSSISLSALARDLTQPQRLVGMHFFNPVPLMKLVEVVSGVHTSPAVRQSISELAEAWGKVPVQAQSTPGFIVNRIARPYYAETLALLQEGAAQPMVVDACLRAAGFRMGPCELMDLIGHDTNLAVTRSVYEANFYDKRYMPSLLQQSMVDAGLLGRKSGRGFYDYSESTVAGDDGTFAPPDNPPDSPQDTPQHSEISVHGDHPIADHFARILDDRGSQYQRRKDSDWCGLQVDQAELRLTDGRCAGQFGDDVAVFDLPLTRNGALAWSRAGNASTRWTEAVPQWLAIFGFDAQPLADAPGLVVARTIAMLINEAADAVQQGVCSESDVDTAMQLGVNYPAGPFAWLADWSVTAVIEMLEHLDDYYHGERYRVSPRLRQQLWQQKK